MLIAVIAIGSRGDVQPYVALGQGLKRSGHVVRIITHQNFEELVNSNKLEFWPIESNSQDIAQSKEMQALIKKGNFLSIMSQMKKEAMLGADALAKTGMAACKDADLIIAGIGGLFVGISLAEKFEIPLLQAYYIPFTPTSVFSSFLFPKLRIPFAGSFNRFSYTIARQIIWQGFRSADKLTRQKVLGLSPASFWGPYRTTRFNQNPVLYGFSPSVIPKPYDWDDNKHVTGYWFLDQEADWSPSSDLQQFLESGTPPVFFGFGSMSNRKPEETADIILQALARTKQRAIMLSGWGGLYKAKLPETVFMLDTIPFSWLYPRVAAVVHHGGAGTTAESFKAGVPSIVTPFMGDQFFWGRRVFELGVGPEPILQKELTVDRLAHAIEKVLTDKKIRKNALELGVKIRAEDGVANSVSVINNILVGPISEISKHFIKELSKIKKINEIF